ncbi:hypothetical protein CGLO_14927 [Colletotrichum gloeosporioides Cg-14]|nr:hypothetical protein CGLO_14927 [Colletotrichum gloeosporioides Cg-14]
MRVLKHS